MIKLNGHMNGNSWNESSRKFEVKTLGTADNGAILCGLNVSGKDKNGNKQYGKSIDIKINVKSKDEAMRVKGLIVAGESMFECDGFFVPSNWTNKEGKEVKGNQFLVIDSTTFQPFYGQAKPKPTSTLAGVEDDTEIPF